MSRRREGPRERLLRVGSPALSDREILELLIGSGGAGGRVETIATRILDRAGGALPGLRGLGPGALRRIPGVGPATAGRIAAAVEVGRRLAAVPGALLPPVRGPQDIYDLIGPRLRDLQHEEFHVVLLNAQNRVLRDVPVTRGILDASLVHPREVFRPAVEEAAAAVILVHNHPSGDPTPSAEDRAVTRQMGEAGRALGIPVLDHVIVADLRWRSLREELG